MVTNGTDLPLKTIRTKPERLSLKGFSRDLSVNSSSSDYFADSPVAVPFLWESQPGTPKLSYRESSTPPLTPPPSLSPARKHENKQPKSSTMLQTVFPRLSFSKSQQKKSPPTLSYTLTPTSYSVPSSPYNTTSRPKSRQSSSTSSSESRPYSDDYESPSSIFCFRFGRRLSTRSCNFY